MSISRRANGSIARCSAPGWWSVDERERGPPQARRSGRGACTSRPRRSACTPRGGRRRLPRAPSDRTATRRARSRSRPRTGRRAPPPARRRRRSSAPRSPSPTASARAASGTGRAQPGCERTTRISSSATSARPDEAVPDREHGLARRSRAATRRGGRASRSPAPRASSRSGARRTRSVPSAVASTTADEARQRLELRFAERACRTPRRCARRRGPGSRRGHAAASCEASRPRRDETPASARTGARQRSKRKLAHAMAPG